MAVAYLRHYFSTAPQDAVVISGGTLGIQGRRADPLARQVVRRAHPGAAGIIDQHRSQGLNPAMVQRADRLVVMAPRHRRFLEERTPQCLPNVVPLWEYVDRQPPLDAIPDPVGHDVGVFARCYDLIAEGLDAWLHDLLAHHSPKDDNP